MNDFDDFDLYSGGGIKNAALMGSDSPFASYNLHHQSNDRSSFNNAYLHALRRINNSSSATFYHRDHPHPPFCFASDTLFSLDDLLLDPNNNDGSGGGRDEFNDVYSDDFGNYNVRAKAAAATKPLRPIKPNNQQKSNAKGGPKAQTDNSNTKKATNPGAKKPFNFLSDNRKPKANAAPNAKNSKPLAVANTLKPPTQRSTNLNAASDRFQLKDYSMPVNNNNNNSNNVNRMKPLKNAPRQNAGNYGNGGNSYEDDDLYGDDPLDMYQLDPFIGGNSGGGGTKARNAAGMTTTRRQNFQNFSDEFMGENTNQNTHLHHQYQQQQLYGTNSQNHSLPNLTTNKKSKIPRRKETIITNSLGRLNNNNNNTARNQHQEQWELLDKPIARRMSPRGPDHYSPYELIPQTPLLVLSSMNNHLPPENLEPAPKFKSKQNKLPAVITFDPDDNDPSSLLNQGRTTSMKAVGALKNPNINEYLYSLSKKDGPKMGYVEQFKEAQRRKTKWHHVGFNFKEYQKFRDNAGFGNNFLDPYGITEPNEVRAEKANKRNEYAKYVRDKNFGVYTKYNHEFKSSHLYDTAAMYEPETYRHVNRINRF